MRSPTDTPEQDQPESGAQAGAAGEPRRFDDPPWNAWDVLVTVFVFVIVDVIGMFGAVLAAVRWGQETFEQAAYNAAIVVPVQFVAYAAGFAFMHWLVTGSYQHPFWQTVRWRWPQGTRQGAGLVAVGVVLAFATSYLETVLPMPKELPIEKFFRTPASAYLMAVLAVAAAPLIEEIFFRGLLYPVSRRVSATFAVVFTSAAFAVVHGTQYGWSLTAVLLLLGVGLVLTITRARTGSVAYGFLIHVGYNLTLFVMLYFSTDHFRHLEKIS
jgi:membrane protease YdiL (CAAX protease family)